jgi:FkbM family methyltransferase
MGFWYIRRGDEPVRPKAVTLKAGPLQLDMPNEMIVSHYATYFAEQYRLSLISTGDTVLDLGAGYGDFSLLAALKVGPRGRVIAVEPDLWAFSFLTRNIRANALSNVVAVHAAIWGDEPHPTLFRQEGTGSKLSDSGSAAVNVVTMEDLRTKVTRIDVIKMDIEGAESSVFRSSMAVIAHARSVFVEVHSPSTRLEISSLLDDAGFTTFTWNMRSVMSTSARNILRHPLEFLEAEYKSGFYALRAATRAFRGKNPVDSQSGLSLIIATKRVS